MKVCPICKSVQPESNFKPQAVCCQSCATSHVQWVASKEVR